MEYIKNRFPQHLCPVNQQMYLYCEYVCQFFEILMSQNPKKSSLHQKLLDPDSADVVRPSDLEPNKKGVLFDNRLSQYSEENHNRKSRKTIGHYTSATDSAINAESVVHDSDDDESVVVKKKNIPQEAKKLNKAKKFNGLFRDGGKDAKRGDRDESSPKSPQIQTGI